MDRYEFNERVEKTEYLVEGDFEHVMHLWMEHAEDARESHGRRRRDPPRYEWQDVNPGSGLQIGTLDGRPIVLSLRWIKIGGALVCFYDGTSQLVDHKMIEEFLDETFPGVKRTDVANFHHFLGYLEKRDPEKVLELKHWGRTIGQEAQETYERDGVLTTSLTNGYVVEKNRREMAPERGDPRLDDFMPRIGKAVEALKEGITEFSRDVWGRWLKTYYQQQKQRGLEANAGNVNMIVWGTAGRVMISLRPRDGGSDAEHLTLIGHEGENESSNTGLQGIQMKDTAAVQLLHDAARLSNDLSNDIRPNDQVGWG